MDITNELGIVEISEEVLCTISSVAANEVEGVVGLANTLSGNIKDLLTKKYAGKGISVELGENGLDITANIIVKFKCNIQDVAVKVQDSILMAIQDMTNYQVHAVNVNVVNVQIADEILLSGLCAMRHHHQIIESIYVFYYYYFFSNILLVHYI